MTAIPRAPPECSRRSCGHGGSSSEVTPGIGQMVSEPLLCPLAVQDAEVHSTPIRGPRLQVAYRGLRRWRKACALDTLFCASVLCSACLREARTLLKLSL